MEDMAAAARRGGEELGRRTGVDRHDILVVLGTGLAGTASALGAAGPAVALETLPSFPPYTATGHHPLAWSVVVEGRAVLVVAGRCHSYEGLRPEAVVHPVRVGLAAGCSTVVLTAAVGAVRPDLRTGSILVVTDQLNLTGRTPLHGPQFVDMVGAYSPALVAAALATPGIRPLAAGVYAQVPGPQFETPAEVRMLRVLGADVVGMSMALETIAARQAGASVLGLAVVTNAAAGDDMSSDEIADAGAQAVPDLGAIVMQVARSGVA